LDQLWGKWRNAVEELDKVTQKWCVSDIGSDEYHKLVEERKAAMTVLNNAFKDLGVFVRAPTIYHRQGVIPNDL